MAIASTLGSYNGDSTAAATTPSRTGSYLEAYTVPLTNKEWAFADEGSYLNIITPTSGAGVLTFATSTTYAIGKLNPDFVFYNGTTKRLYPQFASLVVTVAGTAGTAVRFVCAVDVGNLLTTSGTALTIGNSNIANGTSSTGLVAVAGINVVTETTNVINYGDIVFRPSTIDILGDQYDIIWGAPTSNGGATSRVATIADCSRIVAPICIPPGYMMKLFHWSGSQSAGITFSARFGFVLR